MEDTMTVYNSKKYCMPCNHFTLEIDRKIFHNNELLTNWCTYYGFRELSCVLTNKNILNEEKEILLDCFIDVLIRCRNGACDIMKFSCDEKTEDVNRMYFNKLIDKCLFDDDMIDDFCDALQIYNDCTIPLDVFKTIHDKFGQVYFKTNIRKFNNILKYCITFKDVLSDYEIGTLVKRLQIGNMYVYIYYLLKEIKFTEKQRQKLQSIVILNNLKQ